MMKLIICVVVVCLAVGTNQVPATSGDNAVQNLINSSNFSEDLSNAQRSVLLKKLLETAFAELRQGRSVFGIPSPDPFVLRNREFSEVNENANLNISFNTLNIHGLTKMNFDRVASFKENKTLIIEASIPKAEADGDYKMSGNLLLLPLKGDGDVYATLHGVWAYVKVVIGLDVVSGKVVATIDIPDMTFTYNKLEILLTNLDTQGDPTLNEAIHHFLNNNHEFVMSILRPPIIVRIREILGEFIDVIFKSFDPAYLYPDEVKRMRSNL